MLEAHVVDAMIDLVKVRRSLAVEPCLVDDAEPAGP